MATNSIPISIDLQLAGLKEQLSSIPGLTADAATKMLKEVVSAAKSAEKASKASIDALRKAATSATDDVSDAARSVDELGDRAGDAGSGAAKLAGAFSMISPGAGEAARSVADLADVAEVAAQALMGVGKTGFAGLLTSLGPLALAIGAATLAFSAYQSAAEEAEKATQEAKEAAERATTAYAEMSSQLYDAVIQQRLLSGELTEGEAASLRAGRSVAETFGPALAEAAQRLAAARQAVADYRTELGKGEGSTSSVRARMAELEATAADAENTFGLLRDRYVELTSTATANATATEDAKGAKEALKTASKELSAELKAAEEYWFDEYAAIVKTEQALRDLQALVIEGQLAPGTRDIRNATEAYQQLTDTWGEASKSADDLQMWQADLVIAFSRGEITLAEYEAGLKKVREELVLLSRTKMADLFDSLDIGTVIQGFQAAESGLEGIATMIGGPVAGAIAGIILDLEDTIGTIREQLASLPQILTSAPGLVADLVVDLVEEVVPALMEAAPRIAEALALAVTSPEFITAIVKLNAMIFNPVTGIKVGIEIARGLWDAFLVGWESFSGGQMIDDFRESFRLGVVDAIAEIRAFFEDLVAKLKDLLTFDGEGAAKTGDILREIFTLGSAQTQTYGDSPGVVRAGPQGMNVRVAPNDYLAAHRSRSGLSEMTGGSAPPPAPTYLDLSRGPRAWDGMVARQIRLGGQTSVALQSAGRTGRKTR